MASVVNRKNGYREIQFRDIDGKRKTIRLGRIAKRQATTIKNHVEHIISNNLSKTALPDDTSRFLSGLSETMQNKLAAVGLVEKRCAMELASFVDEYISKRNDVKGSTKVNWGHTRRNLAEFFGADKPIAECQQYSYQKT